jgi:hypothetical protein
MRPRRLRAASLALLALVAGCDPRIPAKNPEAGATKSTRCEVGERADYFVPGAEGGPHTIIGCARLGASGRPVEFSADAERISREPYVCINPAYRGRGELGIYIPSICPPDPVPRRLDVIHVQIPEQAVRRYRLVIWGTVPPSTRRVVVRHHLGRSAAAVFQVNPRLAQMAGTRKPFSLFVVELFPNAACKPILVRARTSAGPATDATRSRPKVCPAA